mmetsp:Transcript_80235/g.247405  ORF Transcript_80235/g.247405 Transcript_80235/m.247405 type:complete len:242 (+) Transcript_80235:866-1591(+)
MSSEYVHEAARSLSGAPPTALAEAACLQAASTACFQRRSPTAASCRSCTLAAASEGSGHLRGRGPAAVELALAASRAKAADGPASPIVSRCPAWGGGGACRAARLHASSASCRQGRAATEANLLAQASRCAGTPPRGRRAAPASRSNAASASSSRRCRSCERPSASCSRRCKSCDRPSASAARRCALQDSSWASATSSVARRCVSSATSAQPLHRSHCASSGSGLRAWATACIQEASASLR